MSPQSDAADERLDFIATRTALICLSYLRTFASSNSSPPSAPDIDPASILSTARALNEEMTGCLRVCDACSAIETPGVRPKIIGIYVLLIVVNLLLWDAALYTSTLFPAFLAFAVAAYLLGLRHAVDADHIAAIDNVTRKLMQENKRPVGVGFFFSLGHSTVVVLIAMLVGLGAKAISAGINDETLRWRRQPASSARASRPSSCWRWRSSISSSWSRSCAPFAR